ncbi:peptidoglycan DD-metalloendopeptidase family protein [Balneolales bacterium ANBcel1]|nr:peptidoglycan DD-metalloendopeptidase family protein [Balneolales bacterium ANBcel1]
MTETAKIHEQEQQENEVEPRLDSFGIDEDFDVTVHSIRRNQSLSTILRNHGYSHRQIHELSIASRGVFDVRRIRAGRPLHLYSHTDETEGPAGNPAYIIYEENQLDYVRFEISDSITVVRGSKPKEVQTRLVSGEIRGSLYQTLRQLDVNPDLTYRLADVFAWQIDFYRIQPGDRFKVLYEEHLVDGRVIETGKIKAAIFTHWNQDYYAFHYRQNDMDEYFDEAGNSLRRQFMAAPLDYTRISSRFTNSRYHPVLNRNMPHHGTDYAAPVGTPIRAVGDGVVTTAGYGRNNGNFVRIRHNSIYETGYLHMSRFADGIRAGVTVNQGQVIGYVGATGLATGPHLCFRFWEHGQPVDPRRIDLPPADPIHTMHRMAFTDRKIGLLEELGLNPDSLITRPATLAGNIGYSGVLSQPEKASRQTTEL